MRILRLVRSCYVAIRFNITQIFWSLTFMASVNYSGNDFGDCGAHLFKILK